MVEVSFGNSGRGRRTGALSTMLALLASPIIWAAHLGVVYFTQSMLCAHGLAPVQVLGIGIVPVAVTVATLAALAALAVAMLIVLRRRFAGRQSGDAADYRTIVAALAILVAAGITWAGIAALMLPSCAALR